MPRQEPRRTHYRTCHLCEAMCGIAIDVEGNRVTAIRGDRDDPFSRGYVCPKAVALQDVHADPDRLRHPVRRTRGGWEQVSWETAFAETAERLGRLQREHGRDAVALYLGNPTVHNHGVLLFGATFAHALGTRNRFSATSVDQLPHHFVAHFMYGHQLLLPVPDIDRTDLLVVLGANPAVSNGSLLTAPGLPRRLAAIRDRGGSVVVIDPRRTETAALADRHHFVRPGTDALLLLGVLHTICAERLARPGRLMPFLQGWDRLPPILARFAPERTAGVTGLDTGTVKALARQFAGAPTAVCYGRLGVSTQAFGALVQWLVQVLNIVTGNLDRAGGAMFARPAVDLVARTGPGHFGTRRTRVRGAPAFASEYPVATMAEEMLTPGAGQIRGLVTLAGNPVLSTPNGRQLDRALAGLDVMVSIDWYINETTRHAHLILPPASPLERPHYDLVFPLLAVRNAAKYAPALFPPAEDARHDWQILLELAMRLPARTAGRRVRRALATGLMARLGPERVLDLALRFGPYGAGLNPFSRGLSLRALEAAPHGVDLGPLQPCLPGRLRTPDRRIQVAPGLLVDDLARLEAHWLPGPMASAVGASAPTISPGGPADGVSEPAAAAEGAPLLLVGRRHLRSNNSWMHNSERLVKGRPRCTVLVHPEDARARNLVDGERARLESRVGAIELAVEVTDEIMPGVVSVPHGWGHDRDGVLLDVARRHAGASVNDLTDDRALDALCGNAVLNGVPVRLTRAGLG